MRRMLKEISFWSNNDDVCPGNSRRESWQGGRGDFGPRGPSRRLGEKGGGGLVSPRIVYEKEGIPLAAREAGVMLKDIRDPQDCHRIWSNIIQEATRKSLTWSYWMLPQHIQQCIVHLRLYPKGYKFDITTLVLSWMAVDVIIHQERSENLKAKGREFFSENLEAKGRKYFYSLVKRSFFQRQES